MNSFSPNQSKLSECNKSIILNVLGTIGGIIMVAVFIGMLNTTNDEGLRSLMIVIILVLGGSSIFNVYNTSKVSAKLNNIQKNRLEITPVKISGMACKNLSVSDSVEYFELRNEEICKVELASSIDDYTLYIHTKTGTYKLCIENAAEAYRQINLLSSQQNEQIKPFQTAEASPASAQAAPPSITQKSSHSWRCPNCFMMVTDTPCPYCGLPTITHR